MFGSRATRSEVLGTFGVAVTSHWIASQVAMAVLERGGNAFDATAAAGFVLQVVEPHQCGPGGEAVIQAAPATAAAPVVVCGQGVAPAAATIERYLAEGLSVVPSIGTLAAVVPGAVGALLMLARDFGRLALADILGPAIGYATRGFPVYPRFLQVLRQGMRLFEAEWPISAAIYAPHGQAPMLGELFANPRLATTLKQLLDEGLAIGAGSRLRRAQFDRARDAFYSGFVAEAIDRFCRNTPVRSNDGIQRTGLLTGQDLASWQASYEPTVSYEYQDLVLHKAGPWSQGPAMLQCLALLRDVGFSGLDGDGAEFIHYLVEATKLALADREAYYGDSGPPANLKYLLSEEYNRPRRALITAEASFGPRPGAVPGCSLAMPVVRITQTQAQSGPALAPVALGAGDTCHVDVIDRWGNMAAMTISGGWMNDSPVIPALGFPLCTRAQMFWLQEGLASSLAPGRRPRTTPSPTIAFHDGRPALAFGARGADMQDQWALQFFLRYRGCGWGLQEALDGTAFYSTHWPSSDHPRRAAPNKVVVATGTAEEVVADLVQRGHLVRGAPIAGWNHSAAAAQSEGVLAAASRSWVHEAGAAGR